MNQRQELKAMIAGVDRLAEAMKKKLRQKAAQGYHGGLDPLNKCMVRRKLQEHTVRLTGMCPHCESFGDDDLEQAVDVAALAMMLWIIGGEGKL